MQFQQLNLIAPLLKAVQAAGYEEPSPIQTKTIPLVLSGRDVLGCAQTGTGKTAAFALPMLQRLHKRPAPKGRPIRALILTPTRELAIQIFENFEQYGRDLPLKTAVIFGGVNQNPQVEKLKAGVDILVATPGRLNDLIGQGFISLAGLEIFVLDEADRMLDMGFIHDVKKVIALLPDKRQTLLFSATMPKEVEELALRLLREPATVKISPVTSTVDKIAQSVYFVNKSDKVELLLWLLRERNIPAALVFTRTKHGANQVAAKLGKAGIEAMAIHGNKSQNARQEALGRFKAGKLRVLVATDIAARGIDVAELPFVINFNVPDTPEAYIHRIGRTGRAGMEGVAFTLCCSDELKDWWDIEKHTRQSVPVGDCPWSVTDMEPTQAPPPGSNRNRAAKPTEQTKTTTQKSEKAPSQPKKNKPQPQNDRRAKDEAKERPQKAAQPAKSGRGNQPAQNQKGKQTSQNQKSNKNETPKQKPQAAQPAKNNKSKQPDHAEAAIEHRREGGHEPSYPSFRSTSSYTSRYGASRPIRPFQSRTSLSGPKAEDYPPPPPTGGMRRDFDIHTLPEMSPLRMTTRWDDEDDDVVETPAVAQAASESSSPAPTANDNAAKSPHKKRRHRGGRRHRKHNTTKSE